MVQDEIFVIVMMCVCVLCMILVTNRNHSVDRVSVCASESVCRCSWLYHSSRPKSVFKASIEQSNRRHQQLYIHIFMLIVHNVYQLNLCICMCMCVYHIVGGGSSCTIIIADCPGERSQSSGAQRLRKKQRKEKSLFNV